MQSILNLFVDDVRVALTLGAVFALLVIASIAVRLKKCRSPERDFTNLHDRICSWWIMVALFALGLTISKTTALVLFGIISYKALQEYLSLVPLQVADQRLVLWALASIIVQYSLIGHGYYGLFLVFIPVFMLLFLPCRRILTGETSGFIRSVGTIHWGLMLMVFGLSHLAYLFVLPSKGAISGASMVLYVVLLTELNDVAQYIWGKSLGRHKISPHVSPNKTWAGFLGGVLTTTLISALVGSWLTPLSTPLAIVAGSILAVAGFFGDLVESAVKRDLGLKDTGAMLPGHGGILDRVDSLTFTAPLMFYFIYHFCY